MSDRALRNVVIGLVSVVLGATLALVLESCDPPDEVSVSASSSGYRVPTSTWAPGDLVAELVITTTSSTTTTTAPPTTTTTTRPSPTTELGTFRVTCYGPPLFPAGQTTASGDPVGPGSIAVDPAVIPLGTVLEVEGYGRGVANDRGSAVRGRHVDVWVEDPSPCPWSRAQVRVVG